jgi:hypothetical protein
MTENHIITPPPELVQQWTREYDRMDPHPNIEPFIATRAAQWGADQELEACLRLVEIDGGEDAYDFARYIRAARRPKPPSLKEQALDELDGIAAVFRMSHGGNLVCDTIRRALEQLDD